MSDGIRLNKYLSSAGICSRREADRLAESGRISVNGKKAEPGQMVDINRDRVTFDDKPVFPEQEKIVIAYHKPAGIVCSTKNQGKERNNIIDAVGFPGRIFPVGRLDKDSTGLILLTNDGELCDRLLRSRNGHEKEYLVQTDREFTAEELRQICRGGIPLEEKRSTKPCRAERIGERRYRFILTEGMNREIRKLAEYFGSEVTKLKRIRFDRITLGDLPEGEYRKLSESEIEALRER